MSPWVNAKAKIVQFIFFKCHGRKPVGIYAIGILSLFMAHPFGFLRWSKRNTYNPATPIGPAITFYNINLYLADGSVNHIKHFFHLSVCITRYCFENKANI